MKNALLLVAGVLFFYSCKKDNQQTNSGSSLPKTLREDVRSGGSIQIATYNLSYDANGRLTTLASIPEPAVTKFIYQYPSATLYTLDLYNTNVLSIHENLWLNASSFLDSTYQYNDTNDTTTEKYIYNGAGQLTELKTYIYSYTGAVPDVTTDYVYDASGNMVKSTDDQGETITYTYYPDLINNFSMGKAFLPQTKNFIKTSTFENGGSPELTTHFYTFDGSNRLVEDSSSTPDLTLTAVKSYTY
jgi:RHS Repeat